MTTQVSRALALAAALSFVAPLGAVLAQENQDIQFASHMELNDIYTRLANLEARAVSATVGDGCGVEYGGKGCGGCNDGCCDRGGFIGGAEILWAKVYESAGDFEDSEYDIGYRFWAGWQAAGGLGVRIRYFDYDLEADSGDVFDVDYIDVEIYDAIRIGCNWDLNVGGGIRYLDLFYDTSPATPADMTGVGPVVSAELVRHVGDWGGVYAIARESIVCGDDDGIDVATAVTELQIGLQAHTEGRNGGLLFARLGWEAQWYDDLDSDESVALMGGVASIGVMR